MKIVIVHPVFSPLTRGGAEVVVDNIARNLARRGEQVAVVTLGEKNETEIIDGVKVVRFRPFNFFNFLDINAQPAWLRLPWHLVDMFCLFAARRAWRLIEAEQPDLILTHNLKGIGYRLPRMIKKSNIKWLQTIHDMQLLHPSGLLPDKKSFTSFLALPYCCLCRWLFGSPPVVIFPSQYIKGVYEKFGFFKQSRRVVIGNPIVILSSLSSLPAGRQARALSALDGNSVNMDSRLRGNDSPKERNFNLLFLGQVERYKGILDLLEALGKVKGEWALNVVGDGQALPEAKIKAQEAFPEGLSGAQNSPRARFWGRLGQTELERDIWPNTDLLINPSQASESFGLVVIEAYAHGVPALVSDKGALPELIREGETGFVVAGENWREKIQWCVDHSDELAKMRPTCLAEAEKYDVEKYLDQLLTESSQCD